MNKKILSILLVAAMAASSTAVLADEPAVIDDNAVLISDTIDASEEGIMLISEDAENAANDEFVIEPTFVNFTALKIVSVEENRIETVDENDEIIILNTSKAVFYNNDGTETSLDKLKAGDELDVFVRADEPAPAIIPAEYTPAVIVNVDPNVSEKVAVDTFIPNPDGGYINTSGNLVIHLPEGFTENKRLDNDFIVFYSITTMSIPPQAPADKVVLLTEPANEFETSDDNASEDIAEESLFEDVAKDSEYAKSVYDVVERGLFKGVSETEFMPDGNMTRAMFVTVLGRLEGFSIKDAMVTGFSDTPGDEYYSTYVVWAHENNIVKGYDDGTFRPDNKVTREEAMQIIWNYCVYKGIAPQDDQSWALRMTYADLEDMSEYAMTAGMWNKLHGYFTEDDSENIRPKDAVTRAEVACAMSVLAGEIEE